MMIAFLVILFIILFVLVFLTWDMCVTCNFVPCWVQNGAGRAESQALRHSYRSYTCSVQTVQKHMFVRLHLIGLSM
jgi:uncharacterized iron-regulated membrane protein